MEELIKILKFKEQELKAFLYDYLQKVGMNPISEDGYLYAKGDIPILLVAHMDTVFYLPPEKIIIKNDSILSTSLKENVGIGGDDRCGVYAIMQLLKKYKPHVLFTEDEEIGLIGAKKAVANLPKPDVKFIIEIDRRGSNDCVFYNCGNEEFIKFIESFGFAFERGICSDISALAPAWDLAAVNLSSGYYGEHTVFEQINFNELLQTIKKVGNILEKDYTHVLPYDYQEMIKTYSSYGMIKNFDDDIDYLLCNEEIYDEDTMKILKYLSYLTKSMDFSNLKNNKENSKIKNKRRGNRYDN